MSGVRVAFQSWIDFLDIVLSLTDKLHGLLIFFYFEIILLRQLNIDFSCKTTVVFDLLFLFAELSLSFILKWREVNRSALQMTLFS